MDRELAKAVFERWNEGLPVYEGTLYKAAEAVGVDPQAVLDEARFTMALDRYLVEKRAMLPWEKSLFSAGAGFDLGVIEKTASSVQVAPEVAILKALEERDWVPDLQKLAFMGMAGGPTEAPSMDPGGNTQDPSPMKAGPIVDAGGQTQAQPPSMGAPPQEGAQVQQVRPSPTAPMQVAPGPGGNLDEIMQMAAQMEQSGQQPAPMGTEDLPPPPSPAEKLQMAVPNMDPANAERYGEELQKLEQQTGIPVSDPKQLQKFVEQLQKGDSKIIDQAIKQVADQHAQAAEQQANAIQQQQQAQDMAQKQQQLRQMQSAPPGSMAPAPGQGQGPGQAAPAPKPQGPGQMAPDQAQMAMQKAAAAGAMLARALRG